MLPTHAVINMIGELIRDGLFSERHFSGLRLQYVIHHGLGSNDSLIPTASFAMI
jgi:hypothetical protein